MTVVLKEGLNSRRTGFDYRRPGAGYAVLGICGGEQLLAVIFARNLIQHIPDSIPNALEHEQPNLAR